MELKYILKHFRINIDKCPKLVVLGGDAVIEKDEFGNFHSSKILKISFTTFLYTIQNCLNFHISLK